MDKIDEIKSESDKGYEDFYDDMRQKIQMRRSQLKEKIDSYTDELLGKINKLQCDNKRSVTESSRTLDSLSVVTNRKPTTVKPFEVLKFAQVSQKYQEFTLNFVNKEFRFDYDRSLSIENIFGTILDSRSVRNHVFLLNAPIKLIINVVFFLQINNSRILDFDGAAKRLMNLCGFDGNAQGMWTLIYRASDDGFRAKDFHARCDGIPNTLTIVKSTNGNVFGGFTERPWKLNEFFNNKNGFIFSLINKDAYPFRAECIDESSFCLARYGPTFGSGKDLCLASRSNENDLSYSNFGSGYQHPNYEFGSSHAKAILAGSHRFRTVEIEVYCKV